MRILKISLAVSGAALALTSPGADAFTCYLLYDRNDNLVYRDTLSPVDMSDQGAAAREAMRQRGDYLVVADADRCPQVTFVFGSAGSSSLSVDTIVGGMPAGPQAGSGSTTRPAARANTRNAVGAGGRRGGDK